MPICVEGMYIASNSIRVKDRIGQDRKRGYGIVT